MTRSETQPFPRVAHLGARGSFSEAAAMEFCGGVGEFVPRRTLTEVFAAIDEGAADLIVVPVENSTAGAVPEASELLGASRLTAVAELVLPITLCVVGCPGASLARVRAIGSHPVALRQCEKFLRAHPHIEMIAGDDTASCARDVIARGDPSRAAIAHRRAAEAYGGAILRERVEDRSDNRTRFLLLAASTADFDFRAAQT